MATTLNPQESVILAFIPLLTRILLRNALPNGRHAYFYDLWGKMLI